MKEILLIDNANAAVNITSTPVDLCDLTVFSIEAIFSGSDLAGTFAIEGSNSGTNFIEITESRVTITAADDVLLVVTNAAYRYVRLTWTRSSGTGNLTARFLMKETVTKRA